MQQRHGLYQFVGIFGRGVLLEARPVNEWKAGLESRV